MASIAKAEKKSLKVLVTGFGAFKDVKTNPSWLAVKPLDNQTLRFTEPPEPGHPHSPNSRHVEIEAHISALEVPVTYSAVLDTIPPLHASKQYDIVLHLGVRRKVEGLAIERLAHKTGYNEPDAEDRLCEPVDKKPKADDGETELVNRGFGRGFEQFSEELSTDVDVDGIVDHLKSKGLVHTSPSDDPGRYLCDFIYFCSLACARKERENVKVLFMHVPPVGLPYEVEDMTKAVEGIIEYLALHS
ncbi:pyroglutamyl-peptidase [Rhizoctonia solani]|uniref:Pyroglutamyl-peptidase n=1 Tax=Rhizoctonia solani TaxID=456999 RepID=A0A0K6FUV8_9AGAM|nr:pyroglutamyl-peptidase [Rhizoctonia solani]